MVLNHTLFKFTVFTNAGINFGGTSSSDWEGIAIDQLVFHHKRVVAKANNLYSKISILHLQLALIQQTVGCQADIQTPNEWQWTQNMGLILRISSTIHFNNYDELPSGWAISSNDNNQWTIWTNTE